MTWFPPFLENIRNLGRSYRTSIHCPDNDVMGPLIVDPCFIVAEDSLVDVLELIAEQPNRSGCKVPKITLSKARVLPCDLNLTAEAQIIAAKYFSACH